MTTCYENKNIIGKFYSKYINRWIPEYAVISLCCCGILNMIIYSGIQIFFGHNSHYLLNSNLDNNIPFVKEWIIVYLACFPFWMVNYILIAREGEESWYRFAVSDYMSRIICGIFFLTMPTTIIRPEITGGGILNEIVKFVYNLDLPTNLFPSIHCMNSWYCFIAIKNSTKIPKWYKCFSFFFSILVFLSTVLTKQHYVIDIFGGVILAKVCLWLSYHISWYKKVKNIFYKVNTVFFYKNP